MHVQGQNRDQAILFPERLDDLIGEDNAVRVIDAFVDSLDLKTLGFARIEVKATGRPRYHPGDLLKLYLYGYMHRVRSSRRLERECHTNLEVLWLLNRLAPDHKTIANFRVDNRVALTRVCRAFVQFCRTQSLYGGNTQAALEALETERATLTERIRAMDEAGLEVQPDTDPEARVMRRGHVGYNVQSSVDGKHRLIVDVDVVQSAADQDQLYRMARRSQRQLQENKMQVLADSGYSSGWHFKRCQAHGLTPYVPVNRSINNHGDGGLFDKAAFSYHVDGDYYECPAGETLPKKTKSTKNRLYLYTTEACTGCRLRERCTTGKQRYVSRHFEEDALNEVAERTEANPMMMRRRKGMVEHPFGTLKRRMDSGQLLLRGLQKVKAEISLAATVYNLTRAINILGTRKLCQALAA